MIEESGSRNDGDEGMNGADDERRGKKVAVTLGEGGEWREGSQMNTKRQGMERVA